MLSNTQLSMSTLVMVLFKQSTGPTPFWRVANPLSCRQGLKIGDSWLVWVTNMTCEHVHMLEPHALLIQQIQGHSQGHLISFVYLVQHLVTACIYIFIICLLQSIHAHATLIEHTEAHGPIYKWHLCHYIQPKLRLKLRTETEALGAIFIKHLCSHNIIRAYN